MVNNKPDWKVTIQTGPQGSTLNDIVVNAPATLMQVPTTSHFHTPKFYPYESWLYDHVKVR